jgi:hypothetical protein
MTVITTVQRFILLAKKNPETHCGKQSTDLPRPSKLDHVKNIKQL